MVENPPDKAQGSNETGFNGLKSNFGTFLFALHCICIYNARFIAWKPLVQITHRISNNEREEALGVSVPTLVIAVPPCEQ